jgi:hypothetical protein
MGKCKKYFNTIANISASQTLAYEIQTTINKIDNLDDRNSIFISKALTKMIAVQCNEINYKEYINDTNNTQVQNVNNFNIMQFNAMADQMTSVAKTITQIGQAFNNIQTYVQDSIQSKDTQIDRITGMIGVRDINVKKLSKNLKIKVEEMYKMKVWATSKEYKEAKEKLFRTFDITAWEQILVLDYNKVNTYISNL